MLFEIIISIIVSLMLAVMCYFIYQYVKHGATNEKLREIVDGVNKANLYNYQFDKNNENNVINMDNTLKSVGTKLNHVVDGVKNLETNAVIKDDLSKSVKTGDLVISNKADINGKLCMNGACMSNANGTLQICKAANACSKVMTNVEYDNLSSQIARISSRPGPQGPMGPPGPSASVPKRICSNRATPWNAEGGGNMIYLDRHNIACNDNENLSRIQFVRDGRGKFQYQYRCCSGV
jgi:hypothetical protein